MLTKKWMQAFQVEHFPKRCFPFSSLPGDGTVPDMRRHRLVPDHMTDANFSCDVISSESVTSLRALD